MINSLEENYDASKISGLYRAVVANNLDPLQLARVQVRVPALHGATDKNSNYVPNNLLPWATPITPVGSGYDHGSCIVPEIGDLVFVFFEDNDRNYPAYLGGCYGRGGDKKTYGNEKDPSTYNGGTWQSPPHQLEVPKEVYNTYGAPTGKIIYKSPKGSTILIEDRDGDEAIRIIDRLGQSINMICPVSPNNNTNNSRQRGGADSRKGSAMKPSICMDGYSEISMIDANGQYLKLINSDVGSYVELACGSKGSVAKVTLDGGGATIRTQGGSIKLGADGSVTIDGSHKVNIEANTIELDSSTCIIRGDLINYS